MMGTLIHCLECNAIMHMTEWDLLPHYAWDEEEIREVEQDDRKAFLHSHRDHIKEKLTPLTPPISDKPYTEPVKTCYFEATNGTKRFVIKKWRTKIDDPFTYEIIDGSIELTNGTVQAQTEAIKKQLQAEHAPFSTEKKIPFFIQAIHEEVETLDPENLEVSAEGKTPLVSYCQLRSNCVDRILTRCQDNFNQHELNMLRDFINRHNEYDGVMTAVATKKFTIKRRDQQGISPHAVRAALRSVMPLP